MTQSTWEPFTGDYEKEFLDVLLPSGEVVYACWPNAGALAAMDGSGDRWTAEDGVKFRVCELDRAGMMQAYRDRKAARAAGAC